MSKNKDLRCIHRHTIKEHPGCFRKGLVKGFDNKDKKMWYQTDGLRIGYLDIETDGLYADFGTMLSWCIKTKGGSIVSSTITKDELFNGTYDQRLVEDLIRELKKYNIIITYYGTGFDLPFIRAKALHYNIPFPSFTTIEGARGGLRLEPEIYHWDLFYLVKSKLRLSRKSLDNACDYLGIKGKTDIDKDMWRKAKYGDPFSLKYVLDHNIGDVVILEELHDRLEPFKKWERKGI